MKSLIKSYKNSLAAGLSLILVGSGCASLKGAENDQNIEKVRSGMSPKKVLALLGTPDAVVRKSKTEKRWIYEFRSREKKGQNYYVDFNPEGLFQMGELSSRDLAAEGEVKQSGICAKPMPLEIRYESLCL